MPETRAKAQGPIDAVGFNGLVPLQFPLLTLAASQANSVVQGILVLPTAVKIYRVVSAFDGSTVAGTCSVNVVAGSAAEIANSGATQYTAMPIPDTQVALQPVAPNTVAYPPAYASAGQRLFLNDQALTMTAYTATVLTPNDSAVSGAYAPTTPGNTWDAIWGPGGQILTLRTVTNGSASGKISVKLLVKFYDPNYSKPVLTPFNPATDIV